MDSKELSEWADHRFKAVMFGAAFSLSAVLGSLLVSVIGNNNDLDLPLTLVVATSVLSSMFLGMGGLDDLAALGRDATSIANTNFGKNWQKAPFGVFKAMMLVSQFLIGLFAILFFYA